MGSRSSETTINTAAQVGRLVKTPVTVSPTNPPTDPIATAAVITSTFDRSEELLGISTRYPESTGWASDENFRRILLSQIAATDYIPATCNLHRRG